MTKLYCDKCEKEIGKNNGCILAYITVYDNEYPGVKIEKTIEMCYDCGKKFEDDYKLIEAQK